MRHLFTSESVGEGHPDKVADQISDAVLDECIRQDKNSRVACEVFTTTGCVFIGGEITTKGYVNFDAVAREVVKDIGYTKLGAGFDCESMAVFNAVHNQSVDISQGVDKGSRVYAGDQGLMFGFACDETPQYMPAALQWSHDVLRHGSYVRKNNPAFAWLRPDSKCQITLEYDNKTIKKIHTIVVSHQHAETWNGKTLSHGWIEKQIREELIKPVLGSTGFLKKDTIYHINPTGRFVIGGPHGDAGLTGRKIISDTYGGMSRHGGGAFSGKDASKVDRSASYMARYIAKNIVASGLATKCEIQLSYAIGVENPVSLSVFTFDTNAVPESVILKIIRKEFDLTPSGIIRTLKLQRPIFSCTSTYGHFGRTGDAFTWEKTNKIKALKSAF